MTDDANPEDIQHQDKPPDLPADELLARLQRLFEAPIGETEMAVRFDPDPETP